MATFTPLVDYTGKINGEALLEQIAGMVTLYWGDEDSAQQVVDLCGGGSILVWHYEPTQNLPCIALVKQGNTYVVWIAGTVNVNQWIGNVMGAACPLTFQEGVLVHQFFWNLSQSLLVYGSPFLPPVGSGAKFVVAGHSLGGAVAQIIGLLLGQTYGKDNVSVLGLAQPKAFTKGLNGAEKWGNYVRVRVLNDPIPMLPPDSDLAYFASFVSPLAIASAGFRWMHYGTGYLLGADGSITPDLPLSYWEQVPGQWLVNVQITNHWISFIAAFASRQ